MSALDEGSIKRMNWCNRWMWCNLWRLFWENGACNNTALFKILHNAICYVTCLLFLCVPWNIRSESRRKHGIRSNPKLLNDQLLVEKGSYSILVFYLNEKILQELKKGVPRGGGFSFHLFKFGRKVLVVGAFRRFYTSAFCMYFSISKNWIGKKKIEKALEWA